MVLGEVALVDRLALVVLGEEADSAAGLLVEVDLQESGDMWLRPVDKKGLFLWLVMVMVGVIAGVFYTELRWEIILFLSTNNATLFAMMIDKIQASSGGRRLSERSLYLMTFLGGSLGMVISIWLFRHKSSKASFQFAIGLLLLLQLVILLWIFQENLPVLGHII